MRVRRRFMNREKWVFFIFPEKTTVQQGVSTARSKWYSSVSARTFLKECFGDNPPVQLDTHQQVTDLSSDQTCSLLCSVVRGPQLLRVLLLNLCFLCLLLQNQLVVIFLQVFLLSNRVLAGRTQVTDITRSDNLKTLVLIRLDVRRKKSNL